MKARELDDGSEQSRWWRGQRHAVGGCTKASVDLGEGTAAYGTESTDKAILSDIENVLTGIGREP
jgi:hypothetical protein